MKTGLMTLNLAILFYISILSVVAQPSDQWDNNEICFNTEAATYPAYSVNYKDTIQTYDTMDYDYNQRYYYDYREGGYKNANSYIHFGRRFDNSDNFSSGVSSYQGTSTGPGPNGGYPGSPRGIYQTNYIDNSTYPNIYRQTYSR